MIFSSLVNKEGDKSMFRTKKYPYGKQSISWSDIWAVVKVLRSDWLTQGPAVKEFEDALCAYTGAQYAVVVANATAALHLAMLALKVQAGDEVITSPNTFLASANCVLYAGGTVVFADIDPKTACIDVEEIKKRITKNTKVIIPVHFSGLVCDMQAIHAIAQEHNLFIVEDAAHAIGSTYKGSKVGSCTYSDMAVFSFHPVKTMTTGEGGAITTNNKDLHETLLRLRSHGVTRDKATMTRWDGPWYYHMNELGFNYRMTDMQAALGTSQLKRLDSFVHKRRYIADYYRKHFAHDNRFGMLEESSDCVAGYHLFPLLLNFEHIEISKQDLFITLRDRGLLLQVLYIPVHTQPYYQQLGFKEGDYPHSEQYYQQTISLPMYFDLKDADLAYIVKTIKEVCI